MEVILQPIIDKEEGQEATNNVASASSSDEKEGKSNE